jgi:hypothetical protein
MEINLDDVNKPGFRPKFISEFSMGQQDFNRYDRTLQEIDLISGLVNSTATPSLEIMQKYLAQLNNLYDNWRPLISVPKVVTDIDDLIKEGIKMKRTWERLTRVNVPLNEKKVLEFVDLCNAIKRKLLHYKQVIGLGIVVKRNMSTRERIKKGIRGAGKLDGLPEA